MPTRNTIRRASDRPWFDSAKRFCSSIAHSTASTALAELDQHAVAHHFNNPTIVLREAAAEYLASTLFEGGQSTGLVLLHEPAVTNYVRYENGGEAALNASFGHVRRLLRQTESYGII